MIVGEAVKLNTKSSSACCVCHSDGIIQGVESGIKSEKRDFAKVSVFLVCANNFKKLFKKNHQLDVLAS